MEATAKRQLDMLHGPIWNKIPRFALPIAATAMRIYFAGLPVVLLYNAVLHRTVDGVATATVLSNAVSAAILYRYLRRGVQH